MLNPAQSVWNKIALLNLLKVAYRGAPDLIDNFAIQKLSFLTELNGRKSNVKAAYWKFFRYTWGPYSPTLANDVAHLEKFGFLDPESREISERGRYLCKYTGAEIDKSALAKGALFVAQKTCESWGGYRGWHIVDRVYDLCVPVDGLDGTEMTVRDIPMHTDILVPESSLALDVRPFSQEMVSDIQAELSIPPAVIDPDADSVWESSASSLQEVFNR